MRARLLLLLGLSACTERPLEGETDATSTTTTSTSSTTTSSTSTSTTSSPTTSTSTTGDPTDTDEPAVCLEIFHETRELPPSWMLTCGLPALCPGDGPLVFTLGGADPYDPDTAETDDLERARCMAAALRDRTPGKFDFWSEQAAREFSIEILGELGIARSVETETRPIDGFDAHESLRRLHAPFAFTACAQGDALDVWRCLVDFAPLECEPGPLPCMN